MRAKAARRASIALVGRRWWRPAARRCVLGDRGAAGVRDTPSDRALRAPRSRRRILDGRPVLAGPCWQARAGRPATVGSRRKAHDGLPGGSKSPPTNFRWRPTQVYGLSLIHISEPTSLGMISYAVF